MWLLVPCTFFFVQIWHYLPHETDDAYIFYRYAQNVVDGYGLLWNRGEQPVEGFSSPLWVILLAMLGSIGTPIPVAANILGLGSLFLLLYLSVILCRHAKIPLWGVLSIGCGLGPLYYWGLSGMETPLFAALFLGTILSLFIPRWWWCASLLAIVRPEGPILFIGWFLYAFYNRVHRPTRLAMAAAPMLMYQLFRFLYFGEYLPNTYYAKVGAPLFERLQFGLSYVQIFIPIVICSGIGLVWKRERTWVPLLLFCLLEMLIIVMGGGDWMFWGRMLVGLFFPLLILVFFLFEHSHRLWGTLLLCFYPFLTPLGVFQSFPKPLPVQGYQEGELGRTSKEVADEIRKYLPPNSQIAINHAGFLPYYLMDYRFIDMTGLNDHYIARTQGGLHQKYDPDYVLRKEPSLIVMNSQNPPQKNTILFDYWEGERQLSEHPLFARNYNAVQRYWKRKKSISGHAYLYLFVRKQP
ncbi:MAG: hypothetical protein VX278_03545 [Myxococcota bacterium]|nr:hypothetical protein [Myxococcota bacterium]